MKGWKEHMAEQSVEQFDVGDDLAPMETVELPREPSDFEKRLRRDLARTREQVRVAHNERDANVAAALRERDEAIATMRNETTARVIRAELKAHALRAGIIDFDDLRLADTSKLALSDDGGVVGADALIETLRIEKPYLFSEGRNGVSPGTTGQTQRPPSPALPSSIDARTLSHDAWRVERNRLLGGES